MSPPPRKLIAEPVAVDVGEDSVTVRARMPLRLA